MFKALLKLLGPWLLKQLEPVLDPEASARAKALGEKFAAIDRRNAEADRLRQAADVVYAAAEEYRRERDAIIAEANVQLAKDELTLRESQARRTEIANQRKGIEDEIARDKAAIATRSDDERFGGRLPGSKPGSKP